MANMFKCVLSSGSGTGYELQVTCSDDFASNNITASDGTTTLTEVCPAASPYVVNFSIPNSGTWTISGTINGITYTNSIEISLSGNLLLETKLSYITWLTEGGLDPSDYANLNAVLADEEAVRRLMTVHDSVDYLATCSNFDDSLLMTVINSNVCAKWINLRDYALDTLYANTYIKTMMDTADKYFYGEWVITDDTTTPATWGPKGNVPVMTSNTAPYGTVTVSSINSVYPGYNAFNKNEGNGQYWATPDTSSSQYIQYEFVNPVCVKKVRFSKPISTTTRNTIKNYVIRGSNDNFASDSHDLYSGLASSSNDVLTWEDVFENDAYYKTYRIFITDSYTTWFGLGELQFYGRELSVSAPVMTSDTAPYGEASAMNYASNRNAYLAFDNNSSTSWSSSANSDINTWLQFKFINNIVPKFILINNYVGVSDSTDLIFNVLASQDGLQFDTLLENQTSANTNTFKIYSLNNSSEYKYIRIVPVQCNYLGDNRVIINELQIYGLDYSEREFAEGSTMKYLYDHGVELETLTTSGTVTKDSDCLTMSASSSSAYASIDITNYDAFVVYVGKHGSGTNRMICGASYSEFSSTNMPYGNGIDITSVTGTNNTGVSQTVTGICDITEMYVM